MSQFEHPGNFDAPLTEPAQTSRMAITAFVLSLLCCPLVTLPGLILGIVSIFRIRANPALKGMGFAVAATIIGLVATTGCTAYFAWSIPIGLRMTALVDTGPGEALQTAFDGNLVEFRARFYGAGATVPDEDTQRFLAQAAERYGDYVGASPATPPNLFELMLDPEAVTPFTFEFSEQTVSGEVGVTISDPATGGMVLKLRSITIVDNEAGDLSYPPDGP